jgi:IMP dehydrogenase
MREGLTFDDVLLVPSYSEIESRADISLAQNFLDLKLELPILSANMDFVTGGEMAKTMFQNGGLGILHRFHDSHEALRDDVRAHVLPLPTPLIPSLGTRDIDLSYKTLETICEIRTPHAVCVDVAHGEHSKVLGLISRLKADNFKVIAGNVATGTGYLRLAEAGADAIKVGIGPGSVCTTREVTGVGVPQLSAIMDIVEKRSAWYNKGPAIIADGGIKNSGDIVKALAAGADVVMLGNLLAGSPECPGEVRVGPDNSRWRPYRGQSIFGVNGDKYVPEGVSGWIKEKPPVAETLSKLAGGIRSGMSYVGARNLHELRENVEFIKVSQATHIESGTRITLDF